MKKCLLVLAALALVLVSCEPPTGTTPNPQGVTPVSNMNLKVQANTGTSSVMSPASDLGARAITSEYYIGLPRQDVFDTLGDPDAIFIGNDSDFAPGVDYDADAYHVYHTVGLSFRIFGPEVKEITLLNDNWVASNGLIVGMSRLEMLEILGDDYQLFETEFKDFYQYSQYDISVEVYHDGDYVGEININEGNIG